MKAITISLAALVCCICGAHLGMYLHAILPGHHRTADTKEIVKLGAGLIATMTALILGLLVSSAKDTFDSMNRELIQDGARIIQLDRILAQYGPDAAELRTTLKTTVQNILLQYWREDGVQESLEKNAETSNVLETLQTGLLTQSPQNDGQRQLLAHAQQLCSDLIQSRWMMIEMTQRDLPAAFLAIVLIWLGVLYICYGLITPHNGTVRVVFFVSALTVSAALFLVLEMNNPITGIIKVSSAPLQKALSLLGR